MTMWIFYITAIFTTLIHLYCIRIIVYFMSACGRCNITTKLIFLIIGVLLIIGGVQPWFRAEFPGVGSLSSAIVILLLLIFGTPSFPIFKKFLELANFGKTERGYHMGEFDKNQINDMYKSIEHKTFFEKVKDFFKGDRG